VDLKLCTTAHLSHGDAALRARATLLAVLCAALPLAHVRFSRGADQGRQRPPTWERDNELFSEEKSETKEWTLSHCAKPENVQAM